MISENDQIATLDTLADEILITIFCGCGTIFHNENTIINSPDLTVENMRKYNVFMAKLKEQFAETLKGCHIIKLPNYVLAVLRGQ